MREFQAMLADEQVKAKKVAIQMIVDHLDAIGENPVGEDRIVSLMFAQVESGAWKMLLTSLLPESRYYEVIHIPGNIGLPPVTNLRVSSLGPVVLRKEE